MGPLRAIPGGPPGSVAWTPLTQSFTHSINRYYQKLFKDYPYFICRFRIFNRFFQGWTADIDTEPHLRSFWCHFFFRKINEKQFRMIQKAKIIKYYPYSSHEKARASFLLSFQDFTKKSIFDHVIRGENAQKGEAPISPGCSQFFRSIYDLKFHKVSLNSIK